MTMITIRIMGTIDHPDVMIYVIMIVMDSADVVHSVIRAYSSVGRAGDS